jgi:hypothetical protein
MPPLSKLHFDTHSQSLAVTANVEMLEPLPSRSHAMYPGLLIPFMAVDTIPRPTEILKLAGPGRSPQGDSLSMHASLLASLDVQSLCSRAR